MTWLVFWTILLVLLTGFAAGVVTVLWLMDRALGG